jgi:hypothetical protein
MYIAIFDSLRSSIQIIDIIIMVNGGPPFRMCSVCFWLLVVFKRNWFRAFLEILYPNPDPGAKMKYIHRRCEPPIDLAIKLSTYHNFFFNLKITSQIPYINDVLFTYHIAYVSCSPSLSCYLYLIVDYNLLTIPAYFPSVLVLHILSCYS